MKKLVLNVMMVCTLSLMLGACSKKSSATQSPEYSANDRGAEDRGNRPPKGDRKGRPEFSELLAKMDTNKDGKLAQSEVQGPLKDNFAQIDSNGDGFLTEPEMKNAPRPERGQRN